MTNSGRQSEFDLVPEILTSARDDIRDSALPKVGNPPDVRFAQDGFVDFHVAAERIVVPLVPHIVWPVVGDFECVVYLYLGLQFRAVDLKIYPVRQFFAVLDI